MRRSAAVAMVGFYAANMLTAVSTASIAIKEGIPSRSRSLLGIRTSSARKIMCQLKMESSA